MDKLKFIDSTGVGWLIRLQKELRAAGRDLALIAPSPVARRALALMKLENFFAAAENMDSAQDLIQALTRERFQTVRPGNSAAPNFLLWEGEITAANAAEVWDLTKAHLCAIESEDLQIDLSGVRFMDSTGLGLMVRIKKLAHRHGIHLTFVHPQPAVKNVVRLARLEKTLLAPEEMALASA
jgi:stage II sporulation protein AA (anti-sigma F factor antagonist)